MILEGTYTPLLKGNDRVCSVLVTSDCVSAPDATLKLFYIFGMGTIALLLLC